MIQSSGAGKIEQLRVSSVGVNSFEREEHKDNRPCLGEIEGQYCKIRTACARYWALNEKNQDYVRPILNGFDECDSRAWMIENTEQRDRFRIRPMTIGLDIASIRDRWNEKQIDKSENVC